ncbi:MAG: 2-C-methyl-D-erythritol 4-phosphate cytidylyltransferase [Marmoricola sp.]
MLAAGEGRRVGHDTNKVLLPLAGRRVFTWAIRWARHLPHVVHTVLVIREQDRPTIEASLAREVGPPEVTVVVGGDTRHGSEWNALQALAPLINSGQVDVVVIHDAARPLASTALFARNRRGVGGRRRDPSHPNARIDHPRPRSPVQDHGVAAVQTPQAFVAAPLA